MLNHKITILYYEPSSGYGGSSRCLLSWVKRLNKDRYNPIVIIRHNGPALQKIRELGIKTIKVPYNSLTLDFNFLFFSYAILLLNFIIFDIPTAIFIYKIAKKNDVKIVHLNSKVITSIPGIIAAKLLKIPCVCHLHDIKTPIKREKFFAKFIDFFIVLTEKAYRLYKKEYSNKRLEIIHNGIVLDDYTFVADKNKLRSVFNIKDEEIIVGMVGRLVEGKGLSDFIKAAKILISGEQKLKFIIVGSSAGEEKKYEIYLKGMVRDLNLGQNVLFAGWREDAKQVMSIFDILVHPSSTFPEGFPLTIIEGMALSKPLVVTDVPGSSEIVKDGETGYVVPSSNPEQLSSAIKKIIDDKEFAKKMGENGRERVKQHYNLGVTVQKLESLYQMLLNNSKSYG